MNPNHRLFFQTLIVAVLLNCSFAATAEEPGEPFIVDAMPRDLEIDYALSALPEHLREEATVYVLNPEKGYEKVREGTNGFHAYVLRTAARRAFNQSWEYSYPLDLYAAMSWDAAGAESCMRVDFDLAELRASGTPAKEAKRIINERLADGTYPPPARAGLSYMLAPVQRVILMNKSSGFLATVSLPHYMFYAPGVSDEDIGGRYGGQHPFIIDEGPHGFMIKVAGPAERAAIHEEHAGLMQRLGAFNEKLRLPVGPDQ